MPLPSPFAGVDITADAGTYMLPLTAVKPSDQSVTSSIVLVNDTALFVPLLANATYEVFLELFWTPNAGGTTPGLQVAWSIPASSTWIYRLLSPGGLVGCASGTGAVTGIPAASGGAFSTESIHGSIQTSVTPGNLQFQFAQNASSATSTTVKAGSILTARRIG